VSVYKYVRADAALRYLESWSLRVTPDQFNDPFELKPTLRLLPESLRDTAPGAILETTVRELRSALVRTGGVQLTAADDDKVDMLARLILGRLSPDEESAFFRSNPTASQESVLAFKAHVMGSVEKILADADAALPAYSLLAQRTFHSEFGKRFGVLCLSRSPKSLLMWGHYAEDHMGAVLEFDGGHPYFKRTLGHSEELGRLFPVRYSDVRPTVTGGDDEDTFANLALTKALPWAYEQEVRLLWPLDHADAIIEPKQGF
jgi:Protein of unknown function (DUF2971)